VVRNTASYRRLRPSSSTPKNRSRILRDMAKRVESESGSQKSDVSRQRSEGLIAVIRYQLFVIEQKER
jgi:hypothetical protein